MKFPEFRHLLISVHQRFKPLSVAVPLWEDPPGVVRVGKSRVLLEIVLDAFKRGESPEAIVRSYETLRLADVHALISRYLENPAPFDEYLRQCEQEAQTVRDELEAAGMTVPVRAIRGRTMTNHGSH